MDKVQFALHTPEVVTLRTPGRIVEGRFGKQTFYSLADGRAMYLDLAVSQKLNVLEVEPGESVGICKRGKGLWDVWLTPETEQMRSAKDWGSALEQQLRSSVTQINEKRYATLAIPRAGAEDTRPVPATDQNHPGTDTRNSTLSLVEEANTVVDAYAAVLARTLEVHQGRVKPDEVRSILLSCYIQMGKAAKYAAA